MKKKYTQNISQLDYLSTLRGNNKLSVSTKPNKAQAMLSNMRHDKDTIIPKAIYHAKIESHLYYSLFILKKKALTRNYN